MTHAIAVLAGGRSSRVGRDKLELRRNGRPLLEHVLLGLPEPWPADVIVVGPRRELDRGLAGRVWFVREEPPDGGPTAGLAAALSAVDVDVLVVLTGDAPEAGQCVQPLLDAVARDGRSAVIVPEGDRPNPVTAAYVTSDLRSAFAVLGPAHNARARELLDLLEWTAVPAPLGSDDDIDTPADAERLGFD